MEKLEQILLNLKSLGCSGIKVSFEDEGALLNEIISMRKLTSTVDLELSIKIGGCEAKRDIVDSIDLVCDTIVAPMIESDFALNKFLKSLDAYHYKGKKGFNLETINGFNNLSLISNKLDKLDFLTFGRVDFVSSLDKDRDFVDTEEMYDLVYSSFKIAREKRIMCYLGGAVSINSKEFINNLYKENLLDKFETRYIIFDAHKIDFNNFEKLLYLANVFEVEWLRYISIRYQSHADKDAKRIKMIDERISKNNNFN